jgi:hypothetical protein
MEIILLKEDIAVFGKEVQTFPGGIREAFDSLAGMLPTGDQRVFYAISQCVDGRVNYKAAALETFEGEAAQYGCERYIIGKGEYLSVKLSGRRDNIPAIRHVFDGIFKNDMVARCSSAVEVYLNDEEMVCMVKTDPVRQLLSAFKAGTETFRATLASFDESEINTVTSHGRWSAGQVARHVHLSDRGMIQILNGKLSACLRDPAQNIQHIKADFLDYTNKNESPEFVRPAEQVYSKAKLIEDFLRTRETLETRLGRGTLHLMCDDFPFPGPDGMSGVELLSFIVYHTERHCHQLEMLKESISQVGAHGSR